MGEFVSARGGPPATATEYTLWMPVWFEEKRIFVSSAEKEAPAPTVAAPVAADPAKDAKTTKGAKPGKSGKTAKQPEMPDD